MLPATLVFGSSPKNPTFQEQHSDAVSRTELVGGAQELSREGRQHLGPCPDGGGPEIRRWVRLVAEREMFLTPKISSTRKGKMSKVWGCFFFRSIYLLF